MVAQERHIAQNDRLLVVLVHDLVHILLLAFSRSYAALPLHPERREHLSDESLSAYSLHSLLLLDEVIVHLDDLLSAAVGRHIESLLLDHILEPVLVHILFRMHINADDERAGKLCLKTVKSLAGESELHTEIVDVHLVVHTLSADGHHLERVALCDVRSLDTELRRNENRLLDLVRIGLCRVVEHICRVSLHEHLHTIYALYLLELGLERHRTSVALHRTETLDGHCLKVVHIHNLHHSAVGTHNLHSPLHIDGRKFELAA